MSNKEILWYLLKKKHINITLVNTVKIDNTALLKVEELSSESDECHVIILWASKVLIENVRPQSMLSA